MKRLQESNSYEQLRTLVRQHLGADAAVLPQVKGGQKSWAVKTSKAITTTALGALNADLEPTGATAHWDADRSELWIDTGSTRVEEAAQFDADLCYNMLGMTPEEVVEKYAIDLQELNSFADALDQGYYLQGGVPRTYIGNSGIVFEGEYTPFATSTERNTYLLVAMAEVSDFQVLASKDDFKNVDEWDVGAIAQMESSPLTALKMVFGDFDLDDEGDDIQVKPKKPPTQAQVDQLKKDFGVAAKLQGDKVTLVKENRAAKGGKPPTTMRKVTAMKRKTETRKGVKLPVAKAQVLSRKFKAEGVRLCAPSKFRATLAEQRKHAALLKDIPLLKEAEEDEVFIVVALDGDDGAELHFTDGNLLVGPFDSEEDAQDAAGEDVITVTGGEVEAFDDPAPAGDEGGDDPELHERRRPAANHLRLRKKVAENIRRQTLLRIRKESEELDSLVTDVTDTDEAGTGEAGAHDFTDVVGFVNDADLGPNELDSLESDSDPAADHIDDNLLESRASASFLAVGRLVDVYEKGVKVDTGIVESVKGNIVVVEGGLEYDLRQHQFKSVVG